MNEVEYFGPHLTLDLGGCDLEPLVNFEKLYDLIKEFPEKIGMHRLSEPQILKCTDVWAKTPGVTGIVILAESHMSFHTFPDARTIFIDIFSCRNFDTEATAKFLIKFFGSKKPVINIVKRGIEFNKHNTPMLMH